MDLILNRSGSGPIFDKQLPVFNIFYPSQADGEHGDVYEDGIASIRSMDFSRTKSVALYFHFPFCETICNFCPFTRGKYSDHKVISEYLEALCREIELKNVFGKLKELPVQAIFVGGGTPSLLEADEILKFGRALHDNFNLEKLKEFSFECEVKSVTEEKVKALKEIGVTNARFGLQTFDSYWREMFDLTASLEQIQTASDLFSSNIKYTSFDILYAMNGHTMEQFERDLERAVGMGNHLVDVYPVDNVVTQPKLHEKTKRAGHAPLTADTRFAMNNFLRDYMKKQGFLPHNGHGYVRASEEELRADPVVTRSYSFEYHNHIYGYQGYDVVGFGVNAISILRGTVLSNPNNRRAYVDQVLKTGTLDTQFSRHSVGIDASRPLVTRLAYHGHVDRSLIDWDEVPEETMKALEDLYDVGLVQDAGSEIVLTRSGWQWYVNIMYYMMPASQKLLLDGFIVHHLGQRGREMTKEQVVFLQS